MIIFKNIRGSKRIAKLRNKIRHKRCLVIMVGSLVFSHGKSVSAIEHNETRTRPEISKVLNNDSRYLQDGDLNLSTGSKDYANSLVRIVLEATNDIKNLYRDLDSSSLKNELIRVSKIQPQTLSLLKEKHALHTKIKHLMNTRQVIDSFYSELVYNKILDIHALPGSEGVNAINELAENHEFENQLNNFKRVRELILERIEGTLSGSLADVLPRSDEENFYKTLLSAQDDRTADLFCSSYMNAGIKYIPKVNIVKSEGTNVLTRIRNVNMVKPQIVEIPSTEIKKLLYKNIIIYAVVLILTLLLTILIRKLKANYRKRITKK